MADISTIPEDRSFDDYPENERFRLHDEFPRYIIDPFEVIFPSDPRYEKALTREELNKQNTN